jgi:hypothetical protein
MDAFRTEAPAQGGLKLLYAVLGVITALTAFCGAYEAGLRLPF